jgi:hypothetical protein
LENNIPVGDDLAVSMHIALGIRLQVSAQGELSPLRPEFLAWTQFLSMLQKYVASQYEGANMTIPKQIRGNLFQTQFGDLNVWCNAENEPARLNERIVIAPYGFYATIKSKDLEAGIFNQFGKLKRSAKSESLRIICAEGKMYCWPDRENK